MTIFTPKGAYDEFREKGIPTDHPFAIRPDDLDMEDWKLTFGLKKGTEEEVLVESVITDLKNTKKSLRQPTTLHHGTILTSRQPSRKTPIMQ